MIDTECSDCIYHAPATAAEGIPPDRSSNLVVDMSSSPSSASRAHTNTHSRVTQFEIDKNKNFIRPKSTKRTEPTNASIFQKPARRRTWREIYIMMFLYLYG